jgi:hypothetical protein
MMVDGRAAGSVGSLSPNGERERIEIAALPW